MGPPRDNDVMTNAPPEVSARRARWTGALAVAAVAGTFALLRALRAPGFPSDLDQLWYAAHALLSGDNPYEAVGPGRALPWTWPLFYPLPGVLLAIPFTVLPPAAARVIFAVVSGGVLGFSVGQRWRVLWPLLLSESFFFAISRSQWSPLVMAAFWLPLAGVVVAAKPNIGAMAVAVQSRRNAAFMIGFAALLVVISFVVRPTWVTEWRAALDAGAHFRSSVLLPGGFLLLAAAFLWRARDSRLLLAAALVPQTPSLYDTLPLFAVCRTVRQALIVCVLSHALQWIVIAFGPYESYEAFYRMLSRLNVFFMLLPVLLVVALNYVVHGVGDDGWIGGLEQTRSAGLRSRGDQVLLLVASCALGLQLWLLFH